MSSDASFERVYTVTDYYDGPRKRLADLGGVPHLYRSLFLDGPGGYDREDDRFELSPVDPGILAMALEDWEIWCRWELAFHSGQTSHDTKPALPQDRARHLELSGFLEGPLRIDPSHRLILRGKFRVRQPVPTTPPGVLRPLEVCWTSVDTHTVSWKQR